MAAAHTTKGRSDTTVLGRRRGTRIEEGARLSQAILRCANRGLTRSVGTPSESVRGDAACAAAASAFAPPASSGAPAPSRRRPSAVAAPT